MGSFLLALSSHLLSDVDYTGREPKRKGLSHFNAIKDWTKDDDSGKLFVGKKIGMCKLSRTCSVGLFYIENVEPFASLTNSIADSLRRWKAFVIP